MRRDDWETTMPFTLNHKLVTAIFALVTFFGTYLAFKATTDLRIAELEKAADRRELRIEAMEARGFPDHERRVTKLEIRTDDQQRTIGDIRARLDTLVAIMERVERSINRDTKQIP